MLGMLTLYRSAFLRPSICSDDPVGAVVEEREALNLKCTRQFAKTASIGDDYLRLAGAQRAHINIVDTRSGFDAAADADPFLQIGKGNADRYRLAC